MSIEHELRLMRSLECVVESMGNMRPFNNLFVLRLFTDVLRMLALRFASQRSSR
jgi:hypothetical protein